MSRNRKVVGDSDNEDFEVVAAADRHRAAAGFEAGEEAPAPEGARRFPHRRKDEDVPRQTLAERLSREHGEDE